MNQAKFGLAVFVIAAVGMLGGCSGGSGNTQDITALQALLQWNAIALDAVADDHGGQVAGQPEQMGPCRTARALAIVHVAMFEALNAANPRFQSYVGMPPHSGNVSAAAAVAKAARDTLAVLYPLQVQTFDDALTADLALIEDGSRETFGLALGQQAASAILGMRFNDGSQIPEPLVNTEFVCSDQPGFWRQDPVSMHPLALGAHWNQVLPFAMTSAMQFRAPAPPLTTDPAYTAAYNEVLAVGGDAITTPTVRTPDQSAAGVFWGYDGAPGLGPPPRLYNQIALTIGALFGLEDLDLARLLALVNVAMADAGIAVWESKYFYQYWRPVAAIRESDPGTGPSLLGDGNAATVGDPTFTPFGAPASNPVTPPSINFTPPFPAYPSGHAGFGGAMFQVLRRYFGTDTVAFTFVSDELNGTTTDNLGAPRPLLPRTFGSFSQAEEENGQSRVYLGIHWAFDKTAGIAQGNQIGDWVFDNLFLPLP